MIIYFHGFYRLSVLNGNYIFFCEIDQILFQKEVPLVICLIPLLFNTRFPGGGRVWVIYRGLVVSLTRCCGFVARWILSLGTWYKKFLRFTCSLNCHTPSPLFFFLAYSEVLSRFLLCLCGCREGWISDDYPDFVLFFTIRILDILGSLVCWGESSCIVNVPYNNHFLFVSFIKLMCLNK